MSSASPLEIARSVVRSAEVLGGERAGVLFDGSPASSLAWRVIRDHRDDAVPVFVDTGLYAPEVHELLRTMFATGDFPIAFHRNDDALRLCAAGRLDVSRHPPDQLSEARLFTTADSVPYSMREPVVRRLLLDRPLEAVYASYDVLFAPDRWEEDPALPFMERVGNAVVVRPLLPMSAEDVVGLVRDLGLSVADVGKSAAEDVGKQADPFEEFVERAMAMAEPARTTYIEERVGAFPGWTTARVLVFVEERLALWKGNDRFGHSP